VAISERLNPQDLKPYPGTKPPDDPVFKYLLQEGVFGNLPIYYAEISRKRVERFDPAFRPEQTEIGRSVVRRIMEDWQRGHFAVIWVYPKGDRFVSADDYLVLAAADAGEPDFLPCYVLGRPSDSAANNIQGPLDQAKMRKKLGIDA
jgi:hypothetical protein